MFNRKNGFKRIVALAAAAVTVIMALAGCSAVITDPVIGKVGDVELYYSNFATLYGNYEYYESVGMMTFASKDEIKEKVFEDLIKNALPVSEALRTGVTLTDEEEQALAAELDETVDGYLADYADQVSPSVTDEAQIKQVKIDLFSKYLKENGTNYKEFLKKTEHLLRLQYLGQKVIDASIADVTATDEQAAAWYTKQLDTEKTSYAVNPEKYYTELTNYYQGYQNVKPLYVPDGYFYIKQILIMNPAEEETDKDIDAIAAEVLQKIADGEDFDSLIIEYGEDTGMTSDTYKDGYLICDSMSGQYVTEFEEAAKALPVGEVSEPVKSTYGIHILKKTGAVPSSETPFADALEEIKAQVLIENQNTTYDAYLETLRADNPVTLYKERVATVGRD